MVSAVGTRTQDPMIKVCYTTEIAILRVVGGGWVGK